MTTPGGGRSTAEGEGLPAALYIGPGRARLPSGAGQRPLDLWRSGGVDDQSTAPRLKGGEEKAGVGGARGSGARQGGARMRGACGVGGGGGMGLAREAEGGRLVWCRCAGLRPRDVGQGRAAVRGSPRAGGWQRG